MDERNPQALALAFRRASAKTLKIKELSIEPSMDEKAVDKLITKLAKEKAESEAMSGDKWQTYVKGQRWYVEDLIKFSSLNVEERLELEYKAAFPDVADEDEMKVKLAELMAS